MSSYFEDRKTRVLKGYHKAMEIFENMETVNSRYVYDLDDRRATYDQVDNVFVRSVVEVPEYTGPPPPQYFDFIKGICHMRDGGKYPDWTGCDKAQPIRTTDFSRPLRAKYEAALAAKWKPDILYNPSELTLRMYPETPVYYSGSQDWHKKVMRETARTYFQGDLSELKCHVSFDTMGQELPPNWTALVPHPQLFKDTYPDGIVEWDGESIRYTWTTSRQHSVVLTPKLWYYCTTSQTDAMLANSHTKFSAAQSYWLFSSVSFRPRKVNTTYRPSYTVPVRFRSDQSHPYYSIKNEEGSEVLGYIDLDQVMEGVKLSPVTEVEVYHSERPVDLTPSNGGVRHTTPLLLLYEGRRKGVYIPEMGFTITQITAHLVDGVLHPTRLETRDLLAVSETINLLYEHLLSLYFRYRHKSFTHQMDRVPGEMISIPDTFQYSPLTKLAGYVSSKVGQVTMSQVKAMVRHQGGMVIRTKLGGIRDRYILEANFPGVENGREAWSFVHSHRMSFLHVNGILPAATRIQIQHMMNVNGLLCWYNYVREEFVVSDPHSMSPYNGSFPLLLVQPEFPVYAEYQGDRYYYPNKIAYKEDVEAYYLDLLGDVHVYGIECLPSLPQEKDEEYEEVSTTGHFPVPEVDYYEFGDEDLYSE